MNVWGWLRRRVEVVVRKEVAERELDDEMRYHLEMQIRDLDGNVLRLGSEPRAGEPFGPWLDMRGDRWIQDSDGKWSRMTGES